MPRPLYPRERAPGYPLDRRLGGPQNRSARRGEEKNSYPYRDSNSDPSAIQPLSQSLYRQRYFGSLCLGLTLFYSADCMLLFHTCSCYIYPIPRCNYSTLEDVEDRTKKFLSNPNQTAKQRLQCAAVRKSELRIPRAWRFVAVSLLILLSCEEVQWDVPSSGTYNLQYGLLPWGSEKCCGEYFDLTELYRGL
jgi:hypothetical protein